MRARSQRAPAAGSCSTNDLLTDVAFGGTYDLATCSLDYIACRCSDRAGCRQDRARRTIRPRRKSLCSRSMASFKTDMIGDFGTNDPNWFDMMRPTKLPAFDGEFGKNGHFYESVRQTRFGVKGATPTALGELFARFEFDMTGVGAQAGQTQIRLRYAYGELGAFGIGQMNSLFMDLDIFPNTLEAWGPERDGVLSEHSAAVVADSRGIGVGVCARTPGRVRRRWCICGPGRACEHLGTVSGTRFVCALPVGTPHVVHPARGNVEPHLLG